MGQTSFVGRPSTKFLAMAVRSKLATCALLRGARSGGAPRRSGGASRRPQGLQVVSTVNALAWRSDMDVV